MQFIYNVLAVIIFGYNFAVIAPPFEELQRLITKRIQPPSTMFHGNPQHTGVYDTLGVATFNKVAWQFKTFASVEEYTSPIIYKDNIYFASSDGFLYAIDLQTGEPRWSFRIQQEDMRFVIQVTPAATNNMIFFGNIGGQLYALDSQTGQEIWRTKDSLMSPPTVYDGVIYYGSRPDPKEPNYLYAADIYTGEEQWRARIGHQAIWAAPAISEGIIYVGSNNKNLIALDSRFGLELWRFDTSAWVISTPTVVDDTVYFGSKDGIFHALDGQTGRALWQFDTGSVLWSSAAVKDGTVYTGGNDMFALDSQTGREKWRFEMEPSRFRFIYSSPVIADGLVYFGGNDTNLYALDAQTGNARWQFNARSRIYSSPVVDNGLIYFSSSNGKLFALQ